jgi:RNA polymerase sigma-70 factor (ECF subfamily)
VNPFEALVEPHRATLRLHCYRMLGSSHDSDDMVQETFVRAFRAQHTLEDPEAARAWLHRIATNVCIDELAKRPRRARGTEVGPPADPDAPPAARTPDAEWLEPAPSAWLSGATPDEGSPALQYTIKESVALAFVAALQVLTSSQRAVLLLRDVVGLSAAETAEALACSVSSANSTLHRARVALEERVGPREGWSPEAVDRALLERYLRVWEKGDLDAIIALLHDDVTLSMPPSPTWIAGRADVARFFANRVMQALREHRFRTALVDANGRTGAGFYHLGDDGEGVFFALQVLAEGRAHPGHRPLHDRELPRGLIRLRSGAHPRGHAGVTWGHAWAEPLERDSKAQRVLNSRRFGSTHLRMTLRELR